MPCQGHISSHDWPNRPALPRAREAGWRWHGCRVQGRRHPLAPNGRAEIPAGGDGTPATGARTLPARGAGCLGTQSSEYLHHLRRWRGEWSILHRHGIPGWADTQALHRRQAAAPRTVAGSGSRNRRRFGCRTRRRDHSPRRQARQYFRHPPRPRQNPRLWSREADLRALSSRGSPGNLRAAYGWRNRGAAHEPGLRCGNDRLHVPRAGSRRAARPAHGLVQLRRRTL